MPSNFRFHEPDEHLSPSAKQPKTRPEPRLPLIVRAFWPVVYAVILIVLLLGVLTDIAHGGGPRYVAGISYFDTGTKGTPLTWTQGTVSYYTDQNDLSTLLPHAAADTFVADAFSRWSGISTAAVSTTI